MSTHIRRVPAAATSVAPWGHQAWPPASWQRRQRELDWQRTRRWLDTQLALGTLALVLALVERSRRHASV